ncbi:MAG: histidine kinase [Muribaculaceae bacterium]|nr:histidine kinase [Muribaculaceae bacterium]
MKRLLKHIATHENAVYAIFWAVLFVVPLLSLVARATFDQQYNFNWTDVFREWSPMLIFLIVFIIHNFFVAPLLVYKQKRILYIVAAVLLIGVFQLHQCSRRPDKMPPPEMQNVSSFPQKPPFDMHDFVTILLVCFSFGANLGYKYYSKHKIERQRQEELEKEALEQELEYLRYQVNPHFFMNTLNNIHALVDIDANQAKNSIVDLSKMMRYVLYESAKPAVSLQREEEFIKNYIALMRLRYTDKVSIDFSSSGILPQATISPLLLIPFVENAFKHGVSYERESFIKVNLDVVDNYLHFTCENSICDSSTVDDADGGVGLSNVAKRLKLLYDEDYKLNIDENDERYIVKLIIPVTLTT